MERQVAGIKRAIASLGRGRACQTRLSKVGALPGAAMTRIRCRHNRDPDRVVPEAVSRFAAFHASIEG